MKIKMKIDQRLKEVGWTRYRLSKETGITYSTLVRLCNNQGGASVHFANIEAICAALGVVNISEIMELEG